MLRNWFVLALFATLASAQTASITGRIIDSAGGVVPDAAVSVRNVDTGAAAGTNTNSDGYYALNALLPGKYDLTVTKAGFETIKQNGLQLAVQQIARLDFSLQVGAVTQSVEVNAQSVVLDSETSTLGQVVQSRQITELPLLGRNPYALAELVPGVRPSIGVNNLPIDQISTVAFAINGQRANANQFLLDGAPNTAPAQNQPVINATPDLVQEFKVETSNFSAEYGNASGGVFNVITRSGTNEFHGALYEFFRNDKLNANDFFANRGGNARPPFKYNQFGGTLGGPVILPKIYNGKNRTFFFVSVESVRFIQGDTFVGTMPTPQQLTGDFSNARNAAGQLVTIYDPATTTSSGSAFTRLAFPGNVIPASRLNPVSLNFAQYLPAPNLPGAPFTGVGNFIFVNANRVNKDTVSYKVDHHFNDNNRFFARYSADDTPDIRAGAYGQNQIASPSAGPQIFGRRNSVVEDDQTISPTWLATVRYSFTRLSNFRSAFSDGFDITKLGLPASLAAQLYPHAFPDVTISGYSITSSIPNIITGGLLGATDQIRSNNNVHALQGNTTKVWGNHEIRAGGEFRVIQLNTQQTGANSPNFAFTQAFTQGPNPTVSSATAGLGLASFLLGVPASGAANPVPALAMTTKYYAMFVQDSFKITSHLTLNYGLRWDYETPREDRFNQFANFNYTGPAGIAVPGLNLHGALSYVGVNGVSRYQGNPDYKNFAPRFGLAYRLGNKTVIRGGGGIFYSSVWGVGTGSNGFGSPGFSATTTLVSSLDGVTPIVSMSNPFPNGLVKPSGNSLGAATSIGQTISYFDRGNRTPYSGQWNLTIQRELGKGMLLEVGYTGSRGLRLPTSVTENQLPDADLALGNALRTLVPNPFFGQVSNGILASSTVAEAQLLRPYPQYDTITNTFADLASSKYNALEVKFDKRYSHGLTLLASYTYSKNTDFDISSFSGDSISAGNIQDYNNLRGEYAPSALDQTQRLVANSLYELPFLKGQHGFVGRVFGGWEVGAILSLFSGSPLGITQSTNNTFSQGGNQRPNWTGVSAKLNNPTVDKWFDTSQFTIAAPYTFGNVARTLNGLRGDGLQELDLTISKTTTIKERFKMQFRSEFFNFTNTPQFAAPNTSLGAAGFGTVSAVNNQPRIVQFALKLLF